MIAIGAAPQRSAFLSAFFTLVGCHGLHALIGVRSVVLDYVHTRARLLAAELLFRAVAVILAGGAVLAVLKLFLGR